MSANHQTENGIICQLIIGRLSRRDNSSLWGSQVDRWLIFKRSRGSQEVNVWGSYKLHHYHDRLPVTSRHLYQWTSDLCKNDKDDNLRNIHSIILVSLKFSYSHFISFSRHSVFFKLHHQTSFRPCLTHHCLTKAGQIEYLLYNSERSDRMYSKFAMAIHWMQWSRLYLPDPVSLELIYISWILIR